MFESLLGFVAQLSLVLWIVVTFTVVVRFVGIRFYRRAARKSLDRMGVSAPSVLDIAARDAIDPASNTAPASAPVTASPEPVPPTGARTRETPVSAMFIDARHPVDFIGAVASTVEPGRTPARKARRPVTVHLSLLASSSAKR